MNKPTILAFAPSADYELLDSGEGEKLERFGDVVLSRPDPQALWRKRLPAAEWEKADGDFGREVGEEKAPKGERGDWRLASSVPKRWSISLSRLSFYIKPTPFKHVGIFPEQASNWDWMRELLGKRMKDARREASAEDISADSSGIEVLNLFAYTGGASLACAQAGAKVVHVDGSKAALAWARENAELSGLKDKPIRWILDDARAFVKREIKRGRRYHGIIMDPPAFGHGADNEVWKIEADFTALVESCAELLAERPIFFLINGYSAGYSSIAYENDLLPIAQRFGGAIEIGELAIEESKTKRLLPCGIFARWSAE
jgi:23S rRNA (cytosine1962-C5)-methyltransferase